MFMYDIRIEKDSVGVLIESTQRNMRGVILCLMHYYEQGDKIHITRSEDGETFEVANSHEDVQDILAERAIHAVRKEPSLLLQAVLFCTKDPAERGATFKQELVNFWAVVPSGEDKNQTIPSGDNQN